MVDSAARRGGQQRGDDEEADGQQIETEQQILEANRALGLAVIEALQPVMGFGRPIYRRPLRPLV